MFDNQLQQYYLRARWYNPTTGRFNRIDPFAGNTHDPQSLHKYLYAHCSPIMNVDPSGRLSLVETMKVISIKVLTFGIPRTIPAMIMRGVIGAAIRFPLTYQVQKIVPPLANELDVFASELATLSPSLSTTVSGFANNLRGAARQNLFFALLAPVTAQVPLVHYSIIGYNVLDFFGSMSAAESMLLAGITKSLSVNTGGVSVNAHLRVRFVPDSRLKIAKGLIANELVPADDVRVATDMLRSLKSLDMNGAKEKWDELKYRMLRYGRIEAMAEIEAGW
jgi:RHS repeat-associated protein